MTRIGPSSRLGRGAAAVLLAGMLVVLAACGGGSDSSSASKSKRDSTTTTKARSTTTTGTKDAASGPFCEHFVALQNQLSQLVQQPTSSSTKDRFDLALRGMRELDQVATPEVKRALATTISVYEQLGPALAAVGYDASKLPADAQARLESPEFKKATDELNAYATTNCRPAATGTPQTPSTTG